MKNKFSLSCVSLFLAILNVYSQEYCYEKFVADSLSDKGLYDEAIIQYRQIDTKNSNRINSYKIAVCFCKKNELDSAAVYFGYALKQGFYYNWEKGMDSDSALFCLKKHPNYGSLSKSVESNRINAIKNIDSTLYKQFIYRKERDQYYRNFTRLDSLKQLKDSTVYINFLNEERESDKMNRSFLDSVIQISGSWPGYEQIGRGGDNAAWLIAQHADDDIIFQEKCLELLENALQNFNTNPHNVAYLYDRIMINKGLQQRFATQMRIIEGKVVFINLEDDKNVEYYRKCYNLPSLASYKKMLEKRYVK